MREVPPLPIRRLIFTTPPLPVAPSASSSASGPPRNRAYPSLAEPLSDAAPCGSWRNSLKTRQTMEECALATPPNARLIRWPCAKTEEIAAFSDAFR